MDKAAQIRQLYQARVDSAITFISQNLERPIGLAEIAQAGNFSPYHFHRIFTAATGENPQDYINRLRLERAANLLLKAPHRSITEVALACGFSSPSTFARSFKKHFGLPASAYARQRGLSQAQAPVNLPDSDSQSLRFTQVQIRWLPALHLAYIADLHGYSLTAICRAWERLCRWASARDLLGVDSQRIGISFDDPTITARERCRYYACLTVPSALHGDAAAGVLDIPAGKHAVFSLSCPPEGIEPAYQSIYRHWLPESGYQPGDAPIYEIYFQTPPDNPQGHFLMEICLPVIPL